MADNNSFDFGSAVSAVYSLQSVDDDTIPLDVLADSEARRIPVEQSPALMFVRRTALELERGEVSWDDFLDRMERLYNKSARQLEQFSQDIQSTWNQVDDNTRQAAGRLQAGLSSIVDGCGRLLECAAEDGDEVKAGLAQIESGFFELDQAEAQAHEELAAAEGA
jgi:hypothetical protein